MQRQALRLEDLPFITPLKRFGESLEGSQAQRKTSTLIAPVQSVPSQRDSGEVKFAERKSSARRLQLSGPLMRIAPGRADQRLTLYRMMSRMSEAPKSTEDPQKRNSRRLEWLTGNIHLRTPQRPGEPEFVGWREDAGSLATLCKPPLRQPVKVLQETRSS